MDDKTFLKVIQEHGMGKDLILSTQEFEEFDASDGKIIVEFKHRGEDYAEQMVEATKIFSNYHYAQKVGKRFFFVVITPKRMVVWDVGDYLENTRAGKVTFDKMTLPSNQHREKGKNINKFVHFIPVQYAVKVVNLKK